MRQANTFWFYALALSLIGTLYRLFFSTGQGQGTSRKDARKKNTRKGDKAVPAAPSTAALVRQAVVDGCDLLIPAEILDWMPTGDLVVGVTMVASTLVTAREIWARVN